MTDATTSDATTDELWDTIERLVAWLDDARTLPEETERILRIMKLSEEVGEATQALIGVLGQNPRKGVSHTWDDVQAELCDVILTAAVALRSINPEARHIFAERLKHVTTRSLTTGVDRTT